MYGITAEQLGRAVGMRLAVELLAAMQRERPGGRYPEPAVRARAAATLRDEQQAWVADGWPLPEASQTVALRTMMDLLEAVIDRWSVGRTPTAGQAPSNRRLDGGRAPSHQRTAG